MIFSIRIHHLITNINSLTKFNRKGWLKGHKKAQKKGNFHCPF